MERIQTFEIQIPEGFEIDKEKSTFEKIVFKEVEKIVTYRDIADKLFQNKGFWIIDEEATITKCGTDDYGYTYPDCSSTKKQLESILALNKLCNVAKYLNGDWLPDITSKNIQDKFSIVFNTYDNNLAVRETVYLIYSQVYFKTRELAKQAIEILGEEEVRKALTLNH